MTTAGQVSIVCPVCHRPCTFTVVTAEPDATADPRCIAVLTVDMDAVLAHCLTHGTHDGEPLPLAA